MKTLGVTLDFLQKVGCKMKRLLFLLIVLSGCGGDATGPESVAGNYTLRTINGQNLPFVVVQVLVDKIEVTAGSVRLNSDKTFSSSLTLATTDGGTTTSATETQTGTYALNGTAITLVFQASSPSSGSISGNTLTIIDEGLSWVFKK